jgi:hypothetical protein
MRVAVVLLLVSLIAGLAMGQSTVRGTRSSQRPTMNPVTEWYVLHGFSKDQVWTAALKVLKAEKIDVGKITENFIFGRQTTGDRMEVDLAIIDHPKADSIRPWAPAVVLNIDAPAIGELGDFPGWSNEQRRAYSRMLSEKIIDVLYGVSAK